MTIEHILEMARSLGFSGITTSDMGDYVSYTLESRKDKVSIKVRAEVYLDRVETQIIFAERIIKGSGTNLNQICSAIELARMFGELRA